MLIDKELIRESFFTLRKKKKTMFFTGLGVAGAIFLLIILMAAGNGLENGVHNRFKSVKTNCLYFYGNYTQMRFNNLPDNRPIFFNYNDFLKAKENFNIDADIITCRYSTTDVYDLYNFSHHTTCYLSAVDYNNQFTRPITMLQGNYVNLAESIKKEKVILLGKTIKSDLFGSSENVLGKYVLLKDAYYKIIGIFESLKEGEAAKFDDNMAIVPITVYNAYNNNAISSIEFICNNESNYQKIKESFTSFLKKIKYINPTDENGLTVSDTKKEYAKYDSLFVNIRYFLWFVSLGMLTMGLMNISNVINITVNERIKEIAIRKAIGATPASILAMIVTETITVTFIAGVTGMLLGLGFVKLIAYIMNKFNYSNEFFMHPYINMNLILFSIFILIVAGLIAAIIPARKASKIKPIEALRND